LIHALFFFFPSIFYGKSAPHSLTQQIAFALVVFHYAKREYETAFVHRFSNATMPFMNVFKNSFHYWILGGLSIAYFLYHPLFTETKSPAFVYFCAISFMICEFGNLHAHLQLQSLRPPGTRARGIPKGALFEYVSCANYTWEIFAWLFFALFTQTLTSYVFFIVSTVQIAIWSLKKHKTYIKEFGSSYPRRKVLFPFVW